jgi:SAM-dependent methyltransferase
MEENRNDSQPKDVWDSGEGYDRYVGRWSRIVADQFLSWLDVSLRGIWLDVGCGTGALTQTILEKTAPRAVLGIDAAQGYINFVRKKITDDRAAFQLGDAQDLPVETAGYDAVVSGFALNFIEDPQKAVAEMARAARPGSRVAIYVWDYAGRMQFMRHFWKAVSDLDPKASELDEGRRFPLCNPGPLAELFSGAGLHHVAVKPIDIWTEFRDFDDFWSPFLGGQGPGPGYVVSLNETDRAALRDRIRAALPFALDGTLPLMARAWAACGIR